MMKMTEPNSVEDAVEASVEETSSLLLEQFMQKAGTDASIGILHIGVYAALLQLWCEQGGMDPCREFMKTMMIRTKVNSTATYSQAIRVLTDSGYIRYQPSFNRNRPSAYYLNIF